MVAGLGLASPARSNVAVASPSKKSFGPVAVLSPPMVRSQNCSEPPDSLTLLLPPLGTKSLAPARKALLHRAVRRLARFRPAGLSSACGATPVCRPGRRGTHTAPATAWRLGRACRPGFAVCRVALSSGSVFRSGRQFRVFEFRGFVHGFEEFHEVFEFAFGQVCSLEVCGVEVFVGDAAVDHLPHGIFE